jgi:DNA-binding beta-propeller fold protein YncE
VARIALPGPPAEAGFDHCAVDRRAHRLYVAHTSNDAVDVVDLTARRYLHSIAGLKGVAGVWVGEASRLLFTSNRAENTTSIIGLDDGVERFRVPTGVRPNGIAFDAGRGLLLVAGVGNAQSPTAPPTVTFVEVGRGTVVGQFATPGRTRWAMYHPASDAFYVNIADPPAVAVIAASNPARIDRLLPIPAKGPHGLEQDPSGRRLYCACDEGVLVTVDLPSGRAERVAPLAGAPDVLWIDPDRQRLYCAVEDPGVVQVFDLNPCRMRETVRTAPGAGTLTVDPSHHEVHVPLPDSHEDLVLRDD